MTVSGCPKVQAGKLAMCGINLKDGGVDNDTQEDRMKVAGAVGAAQPETE